MIDLTFFQEGAHLTGFVASGHAAYAPEGEADILCAAITALCSAAIGTLDELALVDFEYQLEEGEISLKLSEQPTSPHLSAQIHLILYTVYIGARQIEASYGSRYVQVHLTAGTKGGLSHDSR